MIRKTDVIGKICGNCCECPAEGKGPCAEKCKEINDILSINECELADEADVRWLTSEVERLSILMTSLSGSIYTMRNDITSIESNVEINKNHSDMVNTELRYRVDNLENEVYENGTGK